MRRADQPRAQETRGDGIDAGRWHRQIVTVVKYDRGHDSRKGDLTLRERKKVDARRRIYHSAIRLFRTRGYEQTSVQEIADAANVAKGTFFNYFPTKEHVLVAYHQDMGRQILEAIAGRSYTTAEEAVQDALRECAAWAPADPAIARLIIRTIFGSDLLLHSDQRNEARLTEWLAEQLTAGVERDELRRDLDVSLFISLLMGALSSTVIEWVSGDRAFDLEGLLERKVRLLFDAVRVTATSPVPHRRGRAATGRGGAGGPRASRSPQSRDSDHRKRS